MKIYLYTFNTPERNAQLQVAQQKQAGSIFFNWTGKRVFGFIVTPKGGKSSIRIKERERKIKSIDG